jgi:hypothetical protein
VPIGGLDMTGKIVLLVVPALAVVATGTPAYAASPPPPAADLRMTYERPEIAADNSGVTWHWVLANQGAGGAETVVATHRISGDQKIVGVSPPCVGQAADVVCRFDAMKPGERRTGWIKTTVARTGGTLNVNAQVTWRENPTILPDLVDAGAAPGWESWGVSGTDAATRMPRPDPR